MTDSGAAQYSVPIDIPPGRGGIAPALSVTYQSSAGLGLLGVGFGLQGFSMIARCGSYLADDNILKEVRYDSGDNFCLDGQRLVPIAPGSNEYRTRPDTFSRVVAIYDPALDPAVGPRAFKVFTKDGRIREYGGRLDSGPAELTSRIRARLGVIRAWAVSRESDRSGNFMSYRYTNNRTTDSSEDYTESYAPARIDYTGHQAEGAEAADLAPTRSVEFEYFETRNNPLVAYSKSMQFYDNRLLTTIRIHGPSGLIRSYRFKYEPEVRDNGAVTLTASGRSRLTRIEEYSSDNVPVPPTTFEWSDWLDPTDRKLGFVQKDVGPLPSIYERSFERPGIIVGPFFGNVYTADLNGDGIDDLLLDEPTMGQQIGDFGDALHVAFADRANGGFGPVQQASVAVPGFVAPWTLFPMDYNQDGKTDFIYDAGLSRTLLLLSDGTQLKPPQTIEIADPHRMFLDWNGDGVRDLVTCRKDANERGHYTIREWSPSAPGGPGWGEPRAFEYPDIRCAASHLDSDEWVSIDATGDGAGDMLLPVRIDDDPILHDDTPLYLFHNEGGTVQSTFSGLVLGDVHHHRVLDANGDGLMDIASLNSQNVIQLWINTGRGFKIVPVAGPKMEPEVWRRGVVLDANGDGMADILVRRTANIETPHYILMRGVLDLGFVGFETDIPGTVGGLRPLSTDGSPQTSLLGVSDTKQLVMFSNRVFSNDLLTTIRDGVSPQGSPTVSITYDRLVEDSRPENISLYRKQWNTPTCQYPIACVISPRHVVSTYSLTGGTTSGHRSDYHVHYRDGRYDRLGRGWLGFSQVRIDEGSNFGSDGNTDASNDWGSTIRYFDNTTYDPATRRFPNAGRVQVEARKRSTGLQQDLPCELFTTEHDYAERALNQGATYFTYETKRRNRHYKTNVSCINIATGPNTELNAVALFSDSQSTVQADDFGNTTNVTTTTAGLTRKIERTTTYVNDAEHWIIGRPDSETTCGTEVVNGTAQRQCRSVRSGYDPLGLLGSSEVAEPGDVHHVKTTYTRDAFGNVTGTLTTATELGQPVERSTCITYAPQEQMFPFASGVAGTGVLQELTFTEYDRDFGTKLQEVDPNGVRTKWTYDGLARRSTELRADATSTATSLANVSTEGDVSPHLYVTVDGQLESEVAFDGLLRPVKRWNSVVGRSERAFESATYDQRGHLTRHKLPTLEGNVAANTEVFAYDSFGRLLVRISPDLNETVRNIYSGLTTTTKDANGATSATVTDAAGRVAFTFDALFGLTRYAYGPLDTVISVTDPSNHVTQNVFDDYGLVTQTTDPDHGTTTYQYNSFGQPVVTTDANAQAVTELHDGLGRMISRLASDQTSAWMWDAATNGLGKLARTSSAAGVIKEFFYDNLSRVTSEVTTLEGDSLAIQKSYKPAGAQGVGRLDTLTYPDGFAVQYNYDAHGRATQINKLDSGASIWTWTQADAVGRITDETFGNGVLTTRIFSDAQDGVLSSIVSTTPSAAVPQGIVQSLSYTYDARRNLKARSDARPANQHFETFCYDDLNRLTDGAIDADVTCGNGSLYRYTYQPDGNIASSLELGAYTYSPARPHAVASAGSNVYRYDSRGDQIVRPHPTATGAPHRTVIYTSFHKPMAYLGGQVTTGTGSKGARCSAASQSSGACLCTTVDDERICSEDATTFDYDSDQIRTRKRSALGHTIYVSGLYEKKRIKATDTTEQRYLIASPERVVAVVTRTRPSGNTLDAIKYVHVDHAGTTDALTDETGVVVERHSYDPFGQQRSTDWSTLPQSSTAPLGVPLGFTGHEEDAEARLVNMRGRIYDPRVGRFLSPDPRTPGAGSQSWNRYSYVYNNPLNWIDPSGFDGELPMPGGLPPIGALPVHQSYPGWGDPLGNINAVDMSYNPAIGGIQFDFSSEAPNSDSAGWSNIQRNWDAIRQLLGIGSPWAFSSPQDDPLAAAAAQVTGMFDAALKTVQNATPLEAAQASLSVLGFVPGPIGAGANLINAGIETYHGNYGAAAMLAAGAILPGVAIVAELRAGARAAEGVAVIGELGAKVGAAEKVTVASETVTLYHGSIDNFSRIATEGLEAARAPTWVSTDLAAAQNAVGPSRVLSAGQGVDTGIIRSVVPKHAFEGLQSSGGISGSRSWPAFGGGETLTEHVLRSPEAIELFNSGIVR